MTRGPGQKGGGKRKFAHEFEQTSCPPRCHGRQRERAWSGLGLTERAFESRINARIPLCLEHAHSLGRNPIRLHQLSHVHKTVFCAAAQTEIEPHNSQSRESTSNITPSPNKAHFLLGAVSQKRTGTRIKKEEGDAGQGGLQATYSDAVSHSSSLVCRKRTNA